MSEEFKKRFAMARHDYGYHHGHNARGIAPSYIGADSLPQAVNDLHWALHGLQGNMDALDTRMKDFEGNVQGIAEDMKKDVVKAIGYTLIESNTPVTNNSGYLSSLITTRSRVFSDSFGPETLMDPVDRIRGFTENYSWIQYSQKSTACDGNYDKIIDFTYVSTHLEDDEQQPRMVSKAKIMVPNAGLIKRFYVSQHEDNIVLYYLVSQPIPTSTGVGYSGSIRKVEYDRFGDKVNESGVSVNHTPLIMLGAFSADVNNEKDFIQYISTDYKVYQNFNGTDLLIGQLPPDVINLIDPVNDIFSDTKQAFVVFYNGDGTIKFPMSTFTLLDSMDGDNATDKFSIIELNEDSELFKKFVSISPRTETKLIKPFSTDKMRTNEGGVFLESYEKASNNRPTVNGSHIFLLSSTEEIYEVDKFSSNIYDYHTVDGVSPFSLKRERDYIEFKNITFSGKLSKMFPEIKQDFGLSDDVPFTIEFDDSRETETVIIHLKEPFVLTRNIRNYAVDNRRGFTVIHNSDEVRDVADLNILSVYKNLDFVYKKPFQRNYFEKHPKYDTAFNQNTFMRYRVVEPTDAENGVGATEIEYFTKDNKYNLTFNTSTKELTGYRNFNENSNKDKSDGQQDTSPTVNSEYLWDLESSEVLYLNKDRNYIDKPYGTSTGVIYNTRTMGRVQQKFIQVDSGTNANTVTFTRGITDSHSGEWYGEGYIPEPKYLHIPGHYNSQRGFSTTHLGTKTPTHRVFSGIVSHNFVVEDVDKDLAMVTYTITNDIGLIMQYHNLAVRVSKNGRITSTSQPYTLKFNKWIPGKYVGNKDYPLGPDNDSVTQELLDRIKSLENTLANLIQKLIDSGLWDPNGSDIKDASNTDDSNLDNRSKLRGGMKQGMNIAYGTINLFGQDADGQYFIRTNSGRTENDLLGGI